MGIPDPIIFELLDEAARLLRPVKHLLGNTNSYQTGDGPKLMSSPE